MIKFLIPLLLVSCSQLQKDNPPHEPVVDREEAVAAKRALYLELEKDLPNKGYDQEKPDPWGFPNYGDGVLYACLKHISGGEVDWKAAEVSDGRMVRHPKYEHNPEAEKWSYYSKDMLIGELLCIWHDRDLDWLEKRIKRLGENDWDLCGGRDNASSYAIWRGRCLVNMNLKDLMYEIAKSLGGDGHPSTWIPQVWDPWEDDYPAHLTFWQMMLRGHAIHGGLNDNQLDFLRGLSERNPGNALYLAGYNLFLEGSQSAAGDILLKNSLFPADRLPSQTEYCTHYLWQRAQYREGGPNADWQPCDEGETHHGIDLMVAATLVLGEFPTR